MLFCGKIRHFRKYWVLTDTSPLVHTYYDALCKKRSNQRAPCETPTFFSFPQIVPTIRDTTDNFDQMGIEKRKCNLERNYRITNCKQDRAINESKASLVWISLKLSFKKTFRIFLRWMFSILF